MDGSPLEAVPLKRTRCTSVSEQGTATPSMQSTATLNAGSISNSKTLVMGNKKSSAGASDQLFGAVDFVTWVVDADARDLVEAQVASSG